MNDVRVSVTYTANVRFSLVPAIPKQQEEPQQAAAGFFASVIGTWTHNEEETKNQSRTRTEEVLNIGNNCSGVLARTVTSYEKGFAGWKAIGSKTSRFSIRCDPAGRVSGDFNTQLSLQQGGTLLLGASTFTRRR
jgi:hypothetical protein